MTLRNQQGNILIAIVVSMGIAIATLSYFYAQSALIRNSEVFNITVRYNLQTIKNSIRAAVTNPYAIQYTMETMVSGVYVNGNLRQCLKDPTYNCPDIESPLTLYLPDQSIMVGTSSTEGFSYQWNAGTLTCNTFAATGNTNCPFKYNLTWFPECPPSGACTSPQIYIRGNLIININTQNRLRINPQKYQINYRVN